MTLSLKKVMSGLELCRGNLQLSSAPPHATQPFREGKYRFSDGGGTAALAIILGSLTGSTVIYTTKASPSGPNYYDDNGYKKKLAELIKTQKSTIILDIHGSHLFSLYDIDMGTLNGESLLGNMNGLIS